MTAGNNNTSLGKRRGQSLVDILKRPFSRKSMTPPASPGSRLKSNQETREELTTTKTDEATGMQFVPQEATSEFEETTLLPLNTLTTPVTENGQNLEIFPLPLPPTPNASPIAVSGA